ncbi:carbohydrate ABC transporter permease [Neobacillus massiliamazoniensis]|jgi:multiple sugar transport system permease protein|uniref:Binding-protein-dependent transport system inner membrane protein n=1 Tax=Neobacillus massiliamazoniensis TaxID=1499688 RepID=A0A0U1NTQ7_9BACI|nr:sugar ABC transporter permease [Neobacillus massiliamazoniensis]CRK81427.1 binding-protein-dependent transport system inner membrane protein [Neobacillus massiliamazoniensis]
MSRSIENNYSPPLSNETHIIGRSESNKRKKRNTLKPYLYLLPAFLFLGIWMYRPLISTFILAFQKWSMVPGTTPIPVGLENFVRLVSNKDFVQSIGNTIFYTVGLLPFSIIIPLFLAVTTNDMKGKMKNVYRVIFFMPMILAPVTISTIWGWLFHPSNGLVNILLMKLGLIDKNIAYFSDPHFAKWIILLITGWQMVGFSTIMFSAALTGINKDYYEAASLDGAGRFKRFIDITLPLLSPTIIFMITMSILFSSQWTFAYIDTLTTGGPFGTSSNIYYEMYKYGFSNLNVGLSSAASLLFFFIFGIIALVLNYFSRKFAFYDN